MKRSTSVKLTVCLMAAVAAPLAFGAKTAKVTKTTTTKEVKASDVTVLKKETLIAGKKDGKVAEAGKQVQVHYVGTLLNGKKFDSSVDRGQPFTFNLGAGQVIRGWDEGVAGMKEGEKRKLTIPADMAYGSQANGDIPANSPLVFEVELIKVL